jgi:hypothetical protein
LALAATELAGTALLELEGRHETRARKRRWPTGW